MDVWNMFFWHLQWKCSGWKVFQGFTSELTSFALEVLTDPREPNVMPSTNT